MINKLISYLWAKSIKLEYSEPKEVDKSVLGYEDFKQDYLCIFYNSIDSLYLIKKGVRGENRQWIEVNQSILGLFSNAMFGDYCPHLENYDYGKYQDYFNGYFEKSKIDRYLIIAEYLRLEEFHYENYMDLNLGGNSRKFIVEEFQKSEKIKTAVANLKALEEEILNAT